MLKTYTSFSDKETPDGIFLTHAHIGHYAGLMYLGKEAMDAKSIPVHVMPRMKTFLESNGPWSQLVNNHNIAIQELSNNEELKLTAKLSIVPFRVPHRDEYSETVGYTIIGPNKRALFIPKVVFFFHLVCVGWLFFRAENLNQAMQMLNSVIY